MDRAYRFLHWLLCVPTMLWTRMRRRGRENLPADGPAVLVCNHLTLWDMVAVACLTPRYICFVAKAELDRIPIVHQAIGWVRAVCVNRGTADISAIKQLLKRLKDGELVLIFPEGTRNRNPKETPLLPLHEGAAMLALHANVPMIPIWAQGKYNPFTGLRLRVGKEVDFGALRQERRPDLKQATKCVEDALLTLRNEEIKS